MENDLKHGDIVYLKTDPEQMPRMVTGWIVRPTQLIYYLSYDTLESTHYPIEISKEPNELKKLGINK